MSNNVIPPTLSLNFLLSIFLQLVLQFLLTQTRVSRTFRSIDPWVNHLWNRQGSIFTKEITVPEQHKS